MDTRSESRISQPLSPAGLERRLKRRLLKSKCRYLAICTPGLESLLMGELESIEGMTEPAVIRGGVEFSGPLDLVYHTNLRLRTATRILLRIASFTARSYPELYNKVRRIDWELYLGFSKQVAFEVSAKSSRLHHATNVATAVYDGIVSAMTPLGIVARRVDHAPVRIFVRLFDDECTLSIDSSGDPLYRRGYREETAKAPIRESIAAALLLAANWQCFPVIADPLCGAGTFITEAALLSRRIPPGGCREFAFSDWPSCQPSKWERIRSRTREEALPKSTLRLMAGDHDAGAIRAARANASRAQVAADITFVTADCGDFNRDAAWGNKGLIITNPPYGKRIGDLQSTLALFRDFGENLRKSCRGWSYALVVSDRRFVAAARLTPAASVPFSNGGIDVVFVMGRI